MIEADDNRVCGIHPLVAEEYEMHGIGKSMMTQRDYDAIYEAQAQRADEPTAEVSAVHRTACIGADPFCPCQDGDACHYKDLPGSPAMKIRRATEDDYFAEFERMRQTIAELSRRPTMEQYLAVCESAARITKAFEMAMDTWHQLQAEYDALSGRVQPRKASAFPANALRHSV